MGWLIAVVTRQAVILGLWYSFFVLTSLLAASRRTLATSGPIRKFGVEFGLIMIPPFSGTPRQIQAESTSTVCTKGAALFPYTSLNSGEVNTATMGRSMLSPSLTSMKRRSLRGNDLPSHFWSSLTYTRDLMNAFSTARIVCSSLSLAFLRVSSRALTSVFSAIQSPNFQGFHNGGYYSCCRGSGRREVAAQPIEVSRVVPPAA